MTRRIRLFSVVALAIVANLAGCAVKGTDREEVVINGRKITVLNTDALHYDTKDSVDPMNDLSIGKIDKFTEMRGEDWIDNEHILITRENTKLEPIRVGDSMENLRGLYVYETATASQKSLFDETDYIWMPLVSPDRKHILVQSYKDGQNTGMIIDVDGNVVAENHDDNPEKGFHLSYDNAKWVDNEQVIIPTSDQGICLMNTASNITYIPKIGVMQTDTAFATDKKIYYISTDNNLMVYDIATEKNRILKTDILNFELSPKRDMFAVVTKEKSDMSLLKLIDMNGEERAQLAEGRMIFGMSWSPDQTKIAYLLSADKENESGLYLRNLKGQDKVFVSADFMGVENGLKWNPAGNKLLASIGEVKDMKFFDNTYIISLN